MSTDSDRWFIVMRETDIGKGYAKEAINIDDVATFYAKRRIRIMHHADGTETRTDGYDLYIHWKPDIKNPFVFEGNRAEKIMEWLRDIHDIDLFIEDTPDDN